MRWNRFGLVYPARRDRAGRRDGRDRAERFGGKSTTTLPAMLRYQTHVEKDSLHNTPPCFSIYVLALVTRWIKAQGGVAAMEARNRAKAATLYAAIDASGYYKRHRR